MIEISCKKLIPLSGDYTTLQPTGQMLANIVTFYWDILIFACFIIQSNFNGLTIFGTMEICSRHG